MKGHLSDILMGHYESLKPAGNLGATMMYIRSVKRDSGADCYTDVATDR